MVWQLSDVLAKYFDLYWVLEIDPELGNVLVYGYNAGAHKA